MINQVSFPQRILLSLFLYVVLTTYSWADQKAGEQFGGWTVVCNQDNKEQEICMISQNLTYKKDGKQLLNAAIGQLSGTDKEVLVITVRLGVFLPFGIQIQVDQGEGKRYAIQWCLTNGCHAYIELTDEMKTVFTKGNICNVTFQDATRKGVTVPVSLKGFTRAYQTMHK